MAPVSPLVMGSVDTCVQVSLTVVSCLSDCRKGRKKPDQQDGEVVLDDCGEESDS